MNFLHTGDRVMGPAELISYATLAFGSHWDAPLRDHLGVTQRTILRWKTGKTRIAPYYARDLRAICLHFARKNSKAAEKTYRAFLRREISAAKHPRHHGRWKPLARAADTRPSRVP